MLIQCFFQLRPSIFAIFYHNASGKYSKSRADNLAVTYILGALVFNILTLLCINYIFVTLAYTSLNFTNGILVWIMVGILIALSLLSFFLYFRKSQGTELFISRKLAKTINASARSAKTNSDALLLGLFSGVPELLFTIPLYIVSLLEMSRLNQSPITLAANIMLYAFVILIPIFIIYISYSFNRNLAEITKCRIKNKTFIRFVLSLSYLSLAILIIVFRTLL